VKTLLRHADSHYYYFANVNYSKQDRRLFKRRRLLSGPLALVLLLVGITAALMFHELGAIAAIPMFVGSVWLRLRLDPDKPEDYIGS
jgi:uncharacterized membrane protein